MSFEERVDLAEMLNRTPHQRPGELTAAFGSGMNGPEKLVGVIETIGRAPTDLPLVEEL